MNKKYYHLVCSLMLIISSIFYFKITPVVSENAAFPIDGKKYEFDEKINYVITEELDYKKIDSRRVYDGHIVLNGDLKQMVDTNGYPAFNVNSGNVSFSYIFGSSSS